MVTTASSRWDRARYPLASSVKDNARSSTAASPRDVDSPVSEQPSVDAENLKTTVPWYAAVTDLREKPALEPSVFDSLTSRLEENDLQASEGSVTAVSWSRRSLSPPLHDHDSDVRDKHRYSIHIHNGTENRNNANLAEAPTVSQESLDQQSLQSNPASRRSSTGSEHDQSPADSVTRRRTLRRTPRSRRIVAPIPASEVGLATNSARPATLTDESPGLLAGPWKRLSYPLHNTTDVESGQPVSDLAEQPKATLQDQGSGHPHVDSQKDSQVPPLFLPQPEQPSVDTVQEDQAKAKPSSQPRVGIFPSKRTYPLQSPASHIDLRSSSPGPHSPLATFDEHFDEELAEENSASESRIYRRPGYPLQMPTAEFSLIPTEERALPPTPVHVPFYPIPAVQSAVTKGKGRPWGYAELGTPKSAMTANIIELEKYPLQLPPVLAQNPLASSEPSPDDTADEKSLSARSNTQGPKKSLKRKVYPLQSPASTMNLKSESSPQNGEAPRIAESKINGDVQAPTGLENILDHAAKISDANPRRKGYPLQIPTAGSTAESVVTTGKDTSAAYHVNAEPIDIAKDQYETTQKQYRRQKYPLNPPNHAKASEHRTNQPNTSHSEQTTNGGRLEKPNIGSSPSMRLAAEPAPVGEARKAEEKPPASSRPANLAYPIQLAMPEPQRPSSGLPTISVTPGSPDKETAPGLEDRQTMLARKVINQWRRQDYPVQSPAKSNPFGRAVTPQPSMEQIRDYKTEKIHLPKNLNALKDTDKPHTRGRTLVMCLDGTGDKFDDDNSNIVHLVSALKKDDPNQVTYYQAGIGTYGEGGLSGGITAALDMAVGSGLGLHVRDAYHFLMHTYKEGDRICIFGFSRGAYTARCVAGMIHKVGLLPPRNLQQIPFAYEFYADDSPQGWKNSRDFKRTFSIDVNVYFLGCFDSVASVGFIPRTLPLSTTPTNKPHYFRHAMALDERRAKFKVARHKKVKFEETKVNRTNVSATAHWLHTLLPFYRDQNDQPPEYQSRDHYRNKHHPNVTDEEYERLMAEDEDFDTDVLEVWFAGAHADVGGGAVRNDERHKLAQIPLRWMVRQAFDCNTGIIFKTKALAEFGLDVHTLWPRYSQLKAPQHGPPPSVLEKYQGQLPPRQVRRSKLKSVSVDGVDDDMYHLEHPTDEDWTPEQIEDYYDAMSPLNDQLLQAPNWWVLEFWPVQIKLPKAPGEVDIIVAMNMGRYRAAEEAQPLMHWTVRHRMAEMSYRVGVRTAPQVTWKEVV